MQYTAGMEYKGENEFVATSVNYLNQMSVSESGNKVLGELIDSENSFEFKNDLAEGNESGFAFKEYENGGGHIYAGNLLNNNSSEGSKLIGISHELFHGYQYENGQGGSSIWNEVEANAFSYTVSLDYANYAWDNGNFSYGWSTTTGLGRDNTAGQMYQKAFNILVNSPTFNKEAFRTAVRNFRSGSVINVGNSYSRDRYPIRRSNQSKYLLMDLYPLFNE